jgi:CheY-like chemotaxis protein
MHAEQLVILVAEDDPKDLALLRHAVREIECPVHLVVVRDGEEAIEYLRGDGPFGDRGRHPLPDLLLLDLKMPRVTGLEVLKWIKRHKDSARIPTIMLSGSGLEADVEEAYRLGVNTYFTKPNELGKLSELLGLLIQYWSRSQRPHQVPVRRAA